MSEEVRCSRRMGVRRRNKQVTRSHRGRDRTSLVRTLSKGRALDEVEVNVEQSEGTAVTVNILTRIDVVAADDEIRPRQVSLGDSG